MLLAANAYKPLSCYGQRACEMALSVVSALPAAAKCTPLPPDPPRSRRLVSPNELLPYCLHLIIHCFQVRELPLDISSYLDQLLHNTLIEQGNHQAFVRIHADNPAHPIYKFHALENPTTAVTELQ